MQKAKSVFRIHLNVLTIIGTLILSAYVMFNGRRASYEDSLELKNRLRHEEWKQKHKEEEEKRARENGQ
jgi:hypothetical protein